MIRRGSYQLPAAAERYCNGGRSKPLPYGYSGVLPSMPHYCIETLADDIRPYGSAGGIPSARSSSFYKYISPIFSQ